MGTRLRLMLHARSNKHAPRLVVVVAKGERAAQPQRVIVRSFGFGVALPAKQAFIGTKSAGGNLGRQRSRPDPGRFGRKPHRKSGSAPPPAAAYSWPLERRAGSGFLASLAGALNRASVASAQISAFINDIERGAR